MAQRREHRHLEEWAALIGVPVPDEPHTRTDDQRQI